MKNNPADLLLQAIGEISEETLAEVKLPARRKKLALMRTAAGIAAALVLIFAVTAAIMIAVGTDRDPPTAPPSSAVDSPDGTRTDTVSVGVAVDAAVNSLRESGVAVKLSEASLISDNEQPYYLVKLSTDDGIYVCTVDAQSGSVTDITYQASPTAPHATEAQKRASEEKTKDTDNSDSDRMPDSAETATIAANAKKPSNSHSVTVISGATEAPEVAPRSDDSPNDAPLEEFEYPEDPRNYRDPAYEELEKSIYDKLLEDSIRIGEEYKNR